MNAANEGCLGGGDDDGGGGGIDHAITVAGGEQLALERWMLPEWERDTRKNGPLWPPRVVELTRRSSIQPYDVIPDRPSWKFECPICDTCRVWVLISMTTHWRL